MPNKGIIKKFPEAVEKCKTQTEAAEYLGVSKQYVFQLTRRFGITKWRQKNRIHKEIKLAQAVCQQCEEVFYKPINNNPNTFCSKKCQGKWLGTHHGFKKKVETTSAE